MSIAKGVHFLQSLITGPNRLAKVLLCTRSFRFLQKHGVHVTPVHFYSPVPDTRGLLEDQRLWDEPRLCAGIDFQTNEQLDRMERVFAHYARTECNYPRTAEAGEYATDNIYFGYVSAVAMHSLIRTHRPRRVVEVGIGHSSLVIAKALDENRREGHECDFLGIDPYPPSFLSATGRTPLEIIQAPVERVDLDVFLALERGDVLSIDTSHTVRTGGDVVHLYSQVLPRLAAGVLVHVHDIFLPYEYPREWTVRRSFWNEQYLVYAMLAFSARYEIVWAQRHVEAIAPDRYHAAFERTSDSDNHGSYSFWIQCRSGTARYAGRSKQ